MVKFTSQIYKIGINPVVDPPENILSSIFAQAGRSKGPIQVCGKLNGAAYLQTLVKYGGAWRLYINGTMLKDSGLKVGDKACIEIEFDPEPRQIAPSPELRTALQKDKNAQNAFDNLSPSRQKEIIRYIGSLKGRAAIERNVDRIMDHLRGESIDHFLTRSGRTK